jgi:hypothetical protein
VYNRLYCGFLYRLWSSIMDNIIAEVVGWSVLTALVIAAHKGVFWLMTNNILEYFI